MMRFPALLITKLAKARIERVFWSAQRGRVLAFVDPREVLHRSSEHPVSHERIRATISSTAPALWIGESEPLDHPGIAHFVRAIARSGHYIFLETNGVFLRRRIHEFQPLPRVFLTVRLDARGTSRSDLAVEGLRAARLSGFFTTVHSVVRENSDLAELERLREFVLELDLDGWLITAGSADDTTARRTAEARRLIPSVSWRWFSERVESELLTQAKRREAHRARYPEPSQGQSCEEGVNVA